MHVSVILERLHPPQLASIILIFTSKGSLQFALVLGFSQSNHSLYIFRHYTRCVCVAQHGGVWSCEWYIVLQNAKDGESVQIQCLERLELRKQRVLRMGFLQLRVDKVEDEDSDRRRGAHQHQSIKQLLGLDITAISGDKSVIGKCVQHGTRRTEISVSALIGMLLYQLFPLGRRLESSSAIDFNANDGRH